jgi:hypothetical protein
MRKFTTLRQVTGFVKKRLGGRKFNTEDDTPASRVVRFDLDGQRYRFNASVALLEKCVDGNLVIDSTCKELLQKLEEVKK